MIGMIRKIAIAAIVSLTAFGGTAGVASADSWGVYVGGSGYGIEVRDGWGRHDDRGRGWGRHDDRGWGHHGRHHGGRRGECRPHHALEKARWNGMRRAFVADVSRRHVVVKGIRHGDRDRMIFANVRGCPVVRY